MIHFYVRPSSCEILLQIPLNRLTLSDVTAGVKCSGNFEYPSFTRYCRNRFEVRWIIFYRFIKKASIESNCRKGCLRGNCRLSNKPVPDDSPLIPLDCLIVFTVQSVVLHAGKRRVWHSGSISTYKAHVWLYPDAGIGIFAAITGPLRYDTTDVFYDLMHAISDQVVFGIRPPAAPKFTLVTPRPERKVQGDTPPRPLNDYAGTYVGQWLRINATVSVDQKTGSLRLTLGRMLTADMRHYDCLRSQFDAVISGRLWWVAEGFPDRALLPVRFRSSVLGGRPDVLELPLEIDVDSSTPVRWSHFTRFSVGLVADHNNTCLVLSFVGRQPLLFVQVLLCYVFSF